MANNNPMRLEIATPVGRIVQGDCYEPQTTDMDGNPLKVKSGPNIGQDRVSYFIGLAIEKNHPGLAEFFGHYLELARKTWPQYHDQSTGQCTNPNFSWKYIDGDARDSKGKPWSDREGFAGHYIFRFTSGFAPQLLQMQNGVHSAIPDSAGKAIKRGYYAQVVLTLESNNNQSKPGLYANLQAVILAGYGKEIQGGVDVGAALSKAPQTGAGYVPAGMSAIPVGGVPVGQMQAPGMGMQPPGGAMPGMTPPGQMQAPGMGMQPPGGAMPGMTPPGQMQAPGMGMQPPGGAMPGMTPPGQMQAPGMGMQPPGGAQGSFTQAVLHGQLVPTEKAQGHAIDAWRGMGYTDDMLVQQGIFIRQ